MRPNYSCCSKSFIQKLVFFVLMNLAFVLIVSSQEFPEELSASGLKNFREELYLQTDRDLYIIGEQVWLKIFKLNRYDKKPDNLSKVIYAELINSSGFPVEQIKINVKDYSGSASFHLSDTLSSGNYFIRAYTNWMKNFDEKDFAFKSISIINPFQHPEKIKVQPEESAIDTVLFYPEGGTLISGINSRVGVVAFDKSGKIKRIKAVLINENRDTICRITTGKYGFATFLFKPDSTGQYNLLCADINDKTRTFSVGKILKSGITLSVDPYKMDESINIRIKKSPDFKLSSEKYFVLINSNGKIKHLKDINQYTGGSFSIEKEEFPTGISQILLINEKREQISSRWIYIPPDEKIEFNVTTDKAKYGLREKVKVEINVTDNKGNSIKTDLSVSVIKSFLINETRKNIENRYRDIPLLKTGIQSDKTAEINDGLLFYSTGTSNPKGFTNITKTDIHYLPEPEGKIICGSIINSETEEPYKNTDMAFSLVGKAAKCRFYKTNEPGNFYFLMNETGLQEIVIQPLEAGLSNYFIELKPDFLNISGHYQPEPFYLDTSKLEKLSQSIISMQIHNIYQPFLINSQDKTVHPDTTNFYGDAMETVQISKFIRLTTVREVIKEIVPHVLVRKKGGKLQFHISSDIIGQAFENAPLVIVDGTPFNDAEQILNMNSADLERIEVVNLKYFIDGQVFDGIVNFITKKGNLEVLDFDFLAFRQAYTGYKRMVKFNSPQYKDDSLRKSRIPDFRNTLYWNPGLENQKDGALSFEFYTSDEPGSYTILIEGISPEGYTGTFRKEITVIRENAEM
jgi:hypothetical protein